MATKEASKPIGDLERLRRLATLGFRITPRPYRKFMVIQWLIFCAFTVAWIKFNGGLVPWFLYGKTPPKRISSNIDVLDHFTQAEKDGSKIIWIHEVNSLHSLHEALQSDAHMLEADVLLNGQNTADQQLVAVMAQPPAVTSDITLKEWLQLAASSTKGLKLDFKSTEAVGISLQHLQSVEKQLDGPVFLSADILQGPNADTSDNKPIDPQRFLRLCNSLYPQSTLSLGWTTGPAAPGGTNRYDWASVKSMHDLVERWDLKQTLTFPVRATYVKKSIPQLKWLTEMTGGSLTVWSPPDDEVPVADLLLLRYRFPKHSLFYDLHSGLHAEFQPVKEEAELKLSVEDKDIESSIFRADKWKVVKTQGGEVIYLGNEAVLLQKGLLVTKEMYMSPFSLSGRVEFLPQDHDGDADATSSEPGIEIFVLVTQSSRPDTLSGIKCFIGASGTLRLSTQGIPGIDRKVEGYVLGHTACYSFKLSNQDESHLTMNVFRQTECGVRGTTDDREGLLQLSLADIAQSASHIAVHSSTGKGFVAVDQFNIQ